MALILLTSHKELRTIITIHPRPQNRSCHYPFYYPPLGIIKKKKQEQRKGWPRSRRSTFIYGRKSARVVHLPELEWPTTLRRVVAIATITVSGKWEIPASLMKVFNRQNCCTGFRVSNPRTGSWRGPRMKIEIAFSPGIR